MESPYMPLHEIIYLFKQQGFTEKDLDLSSTPGMIEQTLRRAYTDVIRTASKNGILEQIVLEVPGRFDKRQDYVEFNFDLYYNPDSDKLRIRALTAVMNESKKLYLFADTRKLVHSKDAYDDLVDIRTRKVLNLYSNIVRTPAIQHSSHL
jgi:hypothetical protein